MVPAADRSPPPTVPFFIVRLREMLCGTRIHVYSRRLRAALEWHVRDFTDRCGLDVDLRIDGDFDALPDRYRTCVYRAVQEALTNCVRHARATHVTVSVTADASRLDAIVTDDGTGLDPARRRNGLGLRGIEERVKELDGSCVLGNGPGSKGTRLAISLPVPPPDGALLERVGG